MSAKQSTKSARVPSYRLHKASQQAVVTINHKDHYLGPWMTPESRLKYERLITAWMAGDASTTPQESPGDVTIAELCVMFLRWADKHYVKDDQPTSEIVNVRRAIRCLRECYAALPVKQFSPLKLKACRDRLIADGLCRSTVNRYACLMVHMVAFGVENELVSGEVWHSLQAVKPLQVGRSDARETEPIGPVSDQDVEATIPHLAEPYRTMVRLQGLLGCRPGELQTMTGGEVDRSEVIWIYRPRTHKTIHKGKERVIPIGPQAQLLLRPFLPDFPTQLVFRNSRGHKVTRNLFRKAIGKACGKAGIPAWSPNMLRHAAATPIRRQYGLEAAQVVLGHSNAATTEIYAERNLGLACDIAAKMG